MQAGTEVVPMLVSLAIAVRTSFVYRMTRPLMDIQRSHLMPLYCYRIEPCLCCRVGWPGDDGSKSSILDNTFMDNIQGV
ncbi:MAG: hypothetical protein ACKO14_07830 [Armatimonadota bacterium]